MRTAGPARARIRPARESGHGKGSEFVRALEQVSNGIRNPVAKLRFIRICLARYERRRRWIDALPWESVRRRLYHWLGLEELRYLLRANSLGAAVKLDKQTRISLLMSRVAHAGVALAALSGLTLVAAGAYHLWRTAPEPAAAAAPAPADVAAAAEATPAAGVAPTGIWLVEKGAGFEQYSNGLRIDTSFTASGEPRRVTACFDRGRPLEAGAFRATPVGILFHTSESDVWPLEASYNENLRDSSQRLLRYVQRNKLYHYLIDRFGRVVPGGGRGRARRTTPATRSGRTAAAST